jgi:hypothetical protein
VTPYRISAREEKTRDRASSSTATLLRIAGGAFVAAAVASVIAVSLVDASGVRDAVAIGVWVDRVLAVGVPILAIAMGARAKRGSLLRMLAFATAGVWVATMIARLQQPAAVDIRAMAVGFALLRIVSIAGVALLPMVAARRHVLPRWPLLASIGLSAGNASQMLALGSYPVMLAQFEPSLATIVLCALLGYAFLSAARELRGETIDDRAERFPPDATALFEDARGRAAFLGPVRLATDAALAFAIVTFIATTSTVAYSGSLRLDGASAGPEASAFVVLVTGALLWHHRKGVSAAPVVAALVATVAAVVSTVTASAAAFSVALLPLGLAIFGVGIVAPKTRDAATPTMRRWVKLVSATGVMLASAGFFSIYSSSVACNTGEPALARIAKLGAVVFGIMAANASMRIEQHARIELAAEQQRT